MKRLITALALIASLSFGFGHTADAQITNCSKGTSGKQGWSLCTGSTGNAPYTTQHVIVVTCVKWPWLGNSRYDASGDWAPKNSYSIVNCATYYDAKSPRILFR